MLRQVMIAIEPVWKWVLRATGLLTYNPAILQSEIIFSIQESPEGGYEARALGHSIFTEADSLEELKAMIRDAVSCHFDGADKPIVTVA